MNIAESLLYLVACMGAASHLNDMTAGSWHKRIAFALVAGGALGCAAEPFWPTFETGARFVLGLGLALVAAPIIVRDFRIIFGHPPPLVERRLRATPEMQQFERRFERRG